jgi:hypothetical protein
LESRRGKGKTALITRGTLKLAGLLALVLACACGDDDDAQPAKDGGTDAGTKMGGGKSGAGGASGTGSGGSKGTGSGTGSGGDDEDGGGSGMSSGGRGDASVDAGGTSGGGMDASTSVDGGMQTAPGCGGLLDCCTTLPKMERMQCELVANNADDASCDQYKTLVCPMAGGDAGAAPDPKACMTLNACCDMLPRGPVRVACATTVTNGVVLDCEQAQAVFCATSGNADACSTLTDCCDSLPPPQKASCASIVDQGLPAACDTVQMALCP